MTDTTFDCGWDYEPEYDLVRAHRLNQQHYQTSPRFRAFIDKIWAEGQATAEGWRAAYEQELQMRFPLPEFMPWLRTLGKHPYKD